jgi:S-(hydroxymethyl)glutathione dehydrogenase / alcohol dehydrogenase
VKTTAAILVELNAPLVVDEIEMPPLDVGQVLVKIDCSGICGAQLGEISGAKGPDKYLPHMLGHEGGGVVIEIGPGVTQVKPGDHVVMHWRKGAGIQSKPANYKWNGKTLNSGWVTTFSQHSIVSENRLTVIPKDVNFEIAALMGCAVTTALGLINNDAAVKIGQSVAVLGCGGVGLNVVQGAAMVAADPIIAIDIHDSKLEMAKRFGATHVINSAKTDLHKEVRNIVGPRGVDVFVENTGLVRLIEQAFALTANSGRTICVGVPRHDQDITIHSLPLHFGKVLTGCEGGHSQPTTDIPRYISLYQKRKLNLDEQITHRFPLAEINAALDTVRGGEAGRVIVQMPE